MSFCLSAWKNSAPTGRIFMKLIIPVFFRTPVGKIQVSFKSNKNTGDSTWRPMCICGNSCSFLLRMRNVSDRSCRENRNTQSLRPNVCFGDCVEKYDIARGLEWQYGACSFITDNQGYRHSEYVTLIAFPRQQWLRERASVLSFYAHVLSFIHFELTLTTVIKANGQKL